MLRFKLFLIGEICYCVWLAPTDSVLHTTPIKYLLIERINSDFFLNFELYFPLIVVYIEIFLRPHLLKMISVQCLGHSDEKNKMRLHYTQNSQHIAE